MSDQKYIVFSDNLVSWLLHFVAKEPHLQEIGVPSYSELEERCMTGYDERLTSEQQADYETLYKNVDELIKPYMTNECTFTGNLSSEEQKLYQNITSYWKAKMYNARLKATRNKKPDFVC